MPKGNGGGLMFDGKNFYSDNNGVAIRFTCLLDICALSGNLRVEDKIEIWRSCNHSPEQSLLIGYLNSEKCFTLLHNDVPIAIFGFVRNKEQLGTIWLLGSYGIDKIPLTFIRLCKRFIKAMLEDCHELENMVDAEYTKAVKWLRVLGAEVYPLVPHGEARTPFRYFRFKKENYNV